MSDKKTTVTFNIVLPGEVAADLQEWAEFEGRKRANLAAFLVELAVRRKLPEKYPPKEGDYPENA